MKIEIEVLEDQLELLQRIRTLAKVVYDHLGAFPTSFSTSYGHEHLGSVFANLEYDCKKWILETVALNLKLGAVEEVSFGKTSVPRQDIWKEAKELGF